MSREEDGNRTLLREVLDELIPPSDDGSFPGAGELGVGERIEAALAERPDVAHIIQRGLASLRELAERREPLLSHELVVRVSQRLRTLVDQLLELLAMPAQLLLVLGHGARHVVERARQLAELVAADDARVHPVFATCEASCGHRDAFEPTREQRHSQSR